MYMRMLVCPHADTRRMAAKGVISEAAAEEIDLSRVVLTGEAGKCFTDSLSLSTPQLVP